LTTKDTKHTKIEEQALGVLGVLGVERRRLRRAADPPAIAPLRQLPAWVPASAGMSGSVGDHAAGSGVFGSL
jgi:hypothetical protein